jgi:hypothetical protein
MGSCGDSIGLTYLQAILQTFDGTVDRDQGLRQRVPTTPRDVVNGQTK